MAAELDFEDPFAPTAAAAPELDFVDPFATKPSAAPEAPSYAGRVAKQIGLTGLGLAAGTKYAAEQFAATPVPLAAGALDTAANIAKFTTPIGLAKTLIDGGFNADGQGSIAEQMQRGAAAIMKSLTASPVTEAIQQYAPGAMNIGIPGAQGYANETKQALADISQQTAANQAAGPGGFGLDVASGLTQIAPAVGVGLLTRNPALAAATIATPIYGQALQQGEAQGLSPEKNAQRAAFQTGAEFVTELPVVKLLSVPASAIIKQAGTSGLMAALKKIGEGALGEFTQEAQTQILQDVYDNSVLDQNKSLGDILKDAGYAGLVGGIAGGVAAAPVASIEAKQNAKATQADAQAREAYKATLKEVDAGDGTTTYVDAAGTPVGDTLDEANAAVAALPLETIRQRMATPALTPEQQAQTLQTPPVQPAPNVSELPPGYFEAAQQAPLEPLTQPGQAQKVPGSGTISEAELAGAGIDTSQLGEVAPPPRYVTPGGRTLTQEEFDDAQQAKPLPPLEPPTAPQETRPAISDAELAGAGIDTSALGEVKAPSKMFRPGKQTIPEQELQDAGTQEQALPQLETPTAHAQTRPSISEAELTAAGVDTTALGEVAPPTAEAKGATPPIAGVPQPTNVQEASFDVNGNPAEIRRLYDVKGGVRIKNGLRFPRKLLPEFEQKAKEISAAPPVTTEQLGELTTPEDINAPAINRETGRPGSAGELSASGAGRMRPETLGSRTDQGGVRGERVAGGAVVGQAAPGVSEAATVAAGNQSDNSLTQENSNASTQIRSDAGQVRQDNAPEGGQGQGGGNLQRTAEAGTEAGNAKEQVAPSGTTPEGAAPAAEFAPRTDEGSKQQPTVGTTEKPSETSTAKPVPAGAAGLIERLRRTGVDVPDGAYTDARLPGYAGEAVDALAKLFKKRVVVFRAGENAPKKSGGLLFPADPGTIYLNADANVHPAVVFMHELVHSMKRTDPKTYAALEKALLPMLRNREGYVKTRLGGNDLGALTEEEMIADLMADHASDPKFWSDLYGRFDDKSAWQQFSDYIRRLLSNVIDVLYPIGAQSYIDNFNAAYVHVVDAAYNHARAQHGDGAASGEVMESRALPQTDATSEQVNRVLPILDEQVKQANFLQWFAGSKVVDANGDPLRVYHGTGKEFGPVFNTEPERTGSFDLDGIGAWFAESPNLSNEVIQYYGKATKRGAPQPASIPAFISIKNPLVIQSRRDMKSVLLTRGAVNGTGTAMAALREKIKSNPAEAAREIKDRLIASGYDGLHILDDSKFGPAWVAFRPNQIKSAIGNRGTFDSESDSVLESRPLLTTAQGSPPSQSMLDEHTGAMRWGARLWDNMNRMKHAQDKLVEAGLKLEDKMNVWVKENLSRSKMRQMADKVEHDYQQPILNLMQKGKLTLKQVDDYLMALHAPERNAEIAKINPKFPDGGSGMTNAEAASILASFTSEQKGYLTQIEAKMKGLQEMKLSVMQKYGLLEPADVQRLRSMYNHYVPLKTIDDTDTLPGNTGKGLDIRGQEFKRALGRGSRATSPLMVSFQDMARTLVRAHKNEAGNALYELAKDPVAKGLIEIADPANFMQQTTDAQGNVKMAVPSNWWQREDVFVTKVNGVPTYIHVKDKELMSQLRRMGDSELGGAIQAIGQGTRLFARMLTQYNPVFAPVNVIKDAIQASILSLSIPGLSPVKVLASVPANLGRILAHKLKPNQRYQEFLEDGGSTNAYGLTDLNDAISDVEAIGIQLGYAQPSTNPLNTMLRGIKTGLRKTYGNRIVKSAADVLTWYNEAFENAVRLSTYNAARDAGQTRQQAAFLSKELSTNFNKKGEIGPVLNSMYVFVNATMQSNRTLKSLWDKSPRFRYAVFSIALAGVLQDLLGSALGGDDPESGLANLDEAGDWALDHNIVLPRGDKDYLKIPIPYGLNIPFVIGRRLSKALRTGNGLAEMAGILNVLADNLSPIGGFETVTDAKTGATNVSGTITKFASPSLLRPAVSVAFNSNFMGAPIAKEPFQGDRSPAPRSYDFKPGTADYAVKLAQYMNEVTGGNKARPGAINVSPEHIQFLTGEYLGGAGRFGSDVLDMADKASKGKGADIDWSKAPFIRSFSGTESRSDAYSRYRDISSRVAYIKDEQKAGVPVDPAYRAIAPLVDSTEKRLKALRDRRKAAFKADNLALVREIQEQETQAIKQVVKRFNGQQKAR